MSNLRKEFLENGYIIKKNFLINDNFKRIAEELNKQIINKRPYQKFQSSKEPDKQLQVYELQVL